MKEVSVDRADIVLARNKYKEHLPPTPLLPLTVQPLDDRKIFLKLENLQPVGSFKVRGALNALEVLQPSDGVYTASKGNFARGLAWSCRERGVPCTLIAPEHAPAAKLDYVRSLGCDVHLVPLSEWFKIVFETYSYPDMPGTFVHPSFESSVIAGNGVIGLEICDQLEHVDSVVLPFGGGGLTLGVATALGPHVKCYTSEVDTAAPLKAALDTGQPCTVDYTASFVDGIGSLRVSDVMWPHLRTAITDSLVVTQRQVADTVRLLTDTNHVVAEGAGAASVAAALDPTNHLTGNVVCVVSGGCIDSDKLADILHGNIPQHCH